MNDWVWRRGEAAIPFEQVYSAYEFSELVRLGVALAQWLVVRSKRRGMLARRAA